MTPTTRLAAQRGSALLLGLLILIVLTLLGIVAASNSVIEERLTGTYREMVTAQEAAEDALRDTEFRLLAVLRAPGYRPASDGALGPDGCVASGTPCSSGGAGVIPDDLFIGQISGSLAAQTPAWWATNGIAYGVDPLNGGAPVAQIPSVSTQPLTYPELIHVECDDVGEFGCQRRILYYRITSIGFGARPENSVVLESTFASAVTNR